MGILERLKRLFGLGEAGDESAEPPVDDASTDGDEAASARECSVCGTAVGPDAEACPLCHATDLVTSGADSADAADDPEGLDPERAATTTTADGSDTAAASERLAELRRTREEE